MIMVTSERPVIERKCMIKDLMTDSLEVGQHRKITFVEW
jgi:hypothetical protein